MEGAVENMGQISLQVGGKVVLEPPCLQQVLDVLIKSGYRVVAPTVRDGAIVYDEVSSSEDMPVGWTDQQEGGFYRLTRRGDQALFGYAVGPHSWKRFLHPPALRLWQAKRAEGGWEMTAESEAPPRFAFIGVRSCELHAMAVQDKVFMHGAFVDAVYKQRRESAFIVAVNCGQASSTCFCASMNTGPKVISGFDLAITEILELERHYLLVEVGTETGAEVLRQVSSLEARGEEVSAGERVVANTAQHMGRVLDTSDIKDLLYRNHDHPRWEEVASRCLSCGNCTMVCPTCFCTTVEDVTDLTGHVAERWRKWDSCFTLDFSYIHGGSIRPSPKSRYRQWMTHKLASWIDQFGTSGCVGCGRCITWCPVGIDITQEVRAIRESDATNNSSHVTQETNDGNT
jgi:ferredoxin